MQTKYNFKAFFENEKIYNKKNKYFDMNEALSKLKYCVNCKELMDYGSCADKEIKSSNGERLLYISSRKYLMHCSGGCSWTCNKLNYCPRCGHDRNSEKDCNCNKWATESENYIWLNFIDDIMKNQKI